MDKKSKRTRMDMRDVLSEATKGINKSIESSSDDCTHRAVVLEVLNTLNNLYPNHNFKLVKKLKNKHVGKIIGENLDYPEWGIVPDGNLIIMDNTFIVCSTEAKRQGILNPDGTIKHDGGNAIERFAKNLNVMNMAFKNEEILPYLIMCHGPALIRDNTMNKMYEGNFYKKFNVLYNKQGIGLGKGASIFTKLEPFTRDEIYTKCIQLAKMSVEYFENKYYNAGKINCNYINAFG